MGLLHHVFYPLPCYWVRCFSAGSGLCRVEQSGVLAEPCANGGITVVAMGYSLAPKGNECTK